MARALAPTGTYCPQGLSLTTLPVHTHQDAQKGTAQMWVCLAVRKHTLTYRKGRRPSTLEALPLQRHRETVGYTPTHRTPFRPSWVRPCGPDPASASYILFQKQ